MKKTFVAIALALAFIGAFAGYSTRNYVKAPVSVAFDNETNYTRSDRLALGSITNDDIYLISSNCTPNSGNASANNWAVWYKKLDSKTLEVSENNTVTFMAPTFVFYYNKYAVSINLIGENDTGIPQIRAYQTPLTGGAPLGRLTLSTNNNSKFTPSLLQSIMISKTVYVFYLADDEKVNVTNFDVGGSVGTPEFTLTTALDTPTSLSVARGESLGSNELFAIWIENDILKESVVDVKKGNATAVVVGAYDKSYSCSAYATDNKWYGEVCTSTNSKTGTINYFIRTNTTTLVPLANYFLNTSGFVASVPYGEYLTIIYRDSVSSAPSMTYSYEIWDLETLNLYNGRTPFLVIDSGSSWSWFKIPEGGLYTLTYNRIQDKGPLSSIQVGLLLGSSYLASVLGLLLATIAGLLLF